MCFSDSLHAILRRTESLERDYVAQLCVERPLLLHGFKFDLRAFVVVRSYHPFAAYMHRFALPIASRVSIMVDDSNVYARLATKPLSQAAGIADPAAHLTVAKYDPAETTVHVQDVCPPDQLQAPLLPPCFVAHCRRLI